MSKEIKNFLISMLEGFGLSGGTALIWPEVIHGLAVIITGVLSTIAIFYTNRWLRNKHKDEDANAGTN